MSEFRQDRVTGRWVIIAPGRGDRPLQPRRAPQAAQPPFDPHCPFCPGNEAQLPAIVLEVGGPEPPGWRVRVVPNKFPIMAPDAAPIRPADPHRLAGRGLHEVVIESPRHDADLSTLPDAQIAAVLAAYRQRHAALAARPDTAAVILYRNRGSEAGASLAHPHAQIVALPMQPDARPPCASRGHAPDAGDAGCPSCAELARELRDGRRIVEQTQQFLVLVPFAARVPFELLLVPRRHQASFAELDDAGLAALGPLLRSSIRRLVALHGELSYNIVVDAPAGPQPHWGLHILPKLVTWGGLELGTDVTVNPSLPEDDAALLRSAAHGDAPP